jgi:hypothetical protein
MSAVRLAAIDIGGDRVPWEAIGLRADDQGRIPFANGALVFEAGGHGIVGLAIDGVERLPAQIEGIPLRAGTVVAGIEHPIGAFEIDHVVIMTDSLDRTSESVTEALGLECRRIRETETVRQAFHRFADQGGVRGCIIEIVENARVARPALFGLVLNLADLDAAAARSGPDVIGDPKPAVQPGRRIATVRSTAGLGVAVALMSPDR